MKNILFRRKLSKMSRQQLWMLMSFALYTNSESIFEDIKDEISQRNFIGKR